MMVRWGGCGNERPPGAAEHHNPQSVNQSFSTMVANIPKADSICCGTFPFGLPDLIMDMLVLYSYLVR